MTSEFDNTCNRGGLENIFRTHRFKLLTPDEILRYTTIVTSKETRTLVSDEKIEIDRGLTKVNLLVTGLPRLGKTTALTIAFLETMWDLPMKVIEVQSKSTKPEDIFLDDYDAFMYNFAFANSGLSQLIKNDNSDKKGVFIYERRLIDQLVFAEALNKLCKEKEHYPKQAIRHNEEMIGGFINYFKFYLPILSGIIICNSSAETSIRKGSTTSNKLLEKVSTGFKQFPQRIQTFFMGDNPLPIISLDFDKISQPVDTLKRSIYTMINWKLDGKISTL